MRIKLLILIVLIFCGSLSLWSQEPVKSPPPIASEEDEILKIDTNLIQTGVSVTDKNGKFIDNLKQEDFEVSVDGKPIKTLFFDKIIERKQSFGANEQPIAGEGRTLIFFVDDVHLSPESNIRTRKLIEKFVANEMLDDDLVAIIASSGRIGFLQQFTNDKTVLRAALERVKYNRNFSGSSSEDPPMSENDAQDIDRNYGDAKYRFVQLTLKINPGILPQTAAQIVAARANNVLSFARVVTQNTFSLLEESMKKTRVLPGRKAVFFISDGFLLDSGNSDSISQLNKITNAAARSNTVIYSFDATGLAANEVRSAAIELQGPSFTSAGTNFERQDGLSDLAYKTGGRFIRNTNDLQTNLTQVSGEAFTYYRLSWEPELEDGKSEKLRKIEISVKNKPELKVRVNSGYLSESTQTAAKQPAKQLNDEEKMVVATNSLIPKTEIPVALAANYLDTSNDGGLLSATIQINTDFVDFTQENSSAHADLEIVGLIYNASGKREKTFKFPLKINTESARLTKSGNPPFFYEYQTNLKPDLYQMRVAIRDTKSGRIGNTSQWVEIPDLSSGKLHLSSLLIGEKKVVSNPKSVNSNETQAKLQPNVDRYFDKTSALRFFGFIYNSAKKNSTAPNLIIEAQVLKQGNVLHTSPAQLVNLAEIDPARLPYGGEIPLDKLVAGRYELKITVTNSNNKTAATQLTKFQIK